MLQSKSENESRAKYKVGYKQGELEIVDIIKLSFRNKSFVCLCKCGKKVNINRSSFKNRKDCGCIRPLRLDKAKTELVGKRSGKLLAIKWLRTEKSKNIWLCKCDCGNMTEVIRSNFNFRTKSCGRCVGIYATKNNFYEEIPGFLIYQISQSAKVRNMSYELKPEFLWDLFLNQSRKCKLSGRQINFGHNGATTTASLDRIDSKKGYTEDNVQWVHKDVNIIKNKYSESYFIELCSDIYNKNKDYISKVEVPSWADYFLSIAKVVSTRSKDSQTQVGAVLTSDNRIIATGYNSFPPNMDDTILPNMRDLKYDWMSHAEKSCILNSTHPIHQLNEPTIYITMPPCFFCLQLMVQAGIKNIYSIDTTLSSKMSEHKDDFEMLLIKSKINYYLINPDFSLMKKILW